MNPHSGSGSVPSGQPFDFEIGAETPYRDRRELGKGGFAIVYEVVFNATDGLKENPVYARKELTVRGDKESGYIQFLSEVRIMKRLHGHHHMTTYVDSYTQGSKFSIIMEPAASSGSLHDYLQDIYNKSSVEENERVFLRRAIGCLAQGLKFIHGHTIRHKDITPQNVLIHNGNIMYSDFGSSFDCSGLESTTTTGIPYGFHRKYSAPEVVSAQQSNVKKNPTKRNRKTDIFSLGAVCADILDALNPGSIGLELRNGCYAEKSEEVVKVLSAWLNLPEFEASLDALVFEHDKEPRPTEAPVLLSEKRGDTVDFHHLAGIIENIATDKLDRHFHGTPSTPIKVRVPEIEVVFCLLCKYMLQAENNLRPTAENVVELLSAFEHSMGLQDVFCTLCHDWRPCDPLSEIASGGSSRNPSPYNNTAKIVDCSERDSTHTLKQFQGMVQPVAPKSEGGTVEEIQRKFKEDVETKARLAGAFARRERRLPLSQNPARSTTPQEH